MASYWLAFEPCKPHASPSYSGRSGFTATAQLRYLGHCLREDRECMEQREKGRGRERGNWIKTKQPHRTSVLDTLVGNPAPAVATERPECPHQLPPHPQTACSPEMWREQSAAAVPVKAAGGGMPLWAPHSCANRGAVLWFLGEVLLQEKGPWSHHQGQRA